MVLMLVLKELPSRELFEQAAIELAIDPAMVEKDWYITQVLTLMANLNLPGYKIIFSGGTSLSKAFGLIKRFSEDVDFKVISYSQPQNRKALSFLKNTVVTALKDAGISINPENIKARDGNKFFSIEINYLSRFDQMSGLRPHIQLEISVHSLELPPIHRQVQSLLGSLKKEAAEVESIACVDPLETAADKLSALVWRLPRQYFEVPNQDRSLVRHIHDLAALEARVGKDAKFRELVVVALQRDDHRNKEISGYSDEAKFNRLLESLSKDYKRYHAEYNTFVRSVSYGMDDTVPDFDDALGYLRRLIEFVLDTT